MVEQSSDVSFRHGYHFLNVERRTFLQAMFDRLPEKNVVKPHHLVTEIIESEDGVRAILANGTEEQGDVIVGCDGVNSIVRQAMWANANKMMPGFITLAEKRSEATLITPSNQTHRCQHCERRIAVF